MKEILTPMKLHKFVLSKMIIDYIVFENQLLYFSLIRYILGSKVMLLILESSMLPSFMTMTHQNENSDCVNNLFKILLGRWNYNRCS